MIQATQTATAAVSSAGIAGGEANEFLTFTLGQEEYGIGIDRVLEIRSYEAVTRIANAAEFLKGVINLRGMIVPVVDMRIKFSLGKVEYNQSTVMIILNLAGRVVGIVVDKVSDVITLTAEQMRPAPNFSSSFIAKYILGLGTVGQRMLILMDIEQLMPGNDKVPVNSASVVEPELS
ncbi:MAG: chemotaxis protein CheW [Nitrosospira sp.]|nr:chemotaxis protein CheW [Nitrosospira sp.]